MKKQKSPEKQYAFNGQREGEKLLFVFRRHMVSMRKGFYLLVIPFAISSIPVFIWQGNIQMLISPLIGIIIGLIFFSYHFVLWYFTVYIVTDQRIRQVTQHGFFAKDVVELRLSKVQNISYNIPGFSGEIFHFGTIVIQTIVGDLIIHNVENPDKIYNKLQDAVDNAVDSKGYDDEDSR